MQSSDFFLLNPNYRRVPMGGKPLKRMGLPWLPFLLLLMVLSLGFGLAMLARETYNDLAVWCSPLNVHGVVVKRYTTTSDGGKSYHVRYAYQNGNETLVSRDDISHRLYRSLAENSPIELQVSSFDPGASQVMGQQSWWTLGFCWAMIGGSEALMTYLLYDSICTRRRHGLCLKKGRRVEGTAFLTGSDGEGGYMVTAKYSFTSPHSGRNCVGRDCLLRNDLREQPLPKSAAVHLLVVDDGTHMML